MTNEHGSYERLRAGRFRALVRRGWLRVESVTTSSITFRLYGGTPGERFVFVPSVDWANLLRLRAPTNADVVIDGDNLTVTLGAEEPGGRQVTVPLWQVLGPGPFV